MRRWPCSASSLQTALANDPVSLSRSRASEVIARGPRMIKTEIHFAPSPQPHLESAMSSHEEVVDGTVQEVDSSGQVVSEKDLTRSVPPPPPRAC